MRNQIISTTFLSAIAILLLCIALLAPAKANAATALISPSTQLPGIPKAGAPSFAFNDSVNRFGGDVRSWYDNYLIVQNVGGATGSYNFFARNQGSFTYWETIDTSYAGSSGIFDLSAEFDSSGNLIAGTVKITGAIEGIGITDASSVLMTANLVDFVFKDDLIGFSINNIICDPEGGPNGGRIEGCASNATQVESIYFGLAADFPGIKQLGGMNYRSTITSVTSVPIPATAWLMLSGLSLIGSMALRRKN
jgi:hypothetical protein